VRARRFATPRTVTVGDAGALSGAHRLALRAELQRPLRTGQRPAASATRRPARLTVTLATAPRSGRDTPSQVLGESYDGLGLDRRRCGRRPVGAQRLACAARPVGADGRSGGRGFTWRRSVMHPVDAGPNDELLPVIRRGSARQRWPRVPPAGRPHPAPSAVQPRQRLQSWSRRPPHVSADSRIPHTGWAELLLTAVP
jgi:hypothetical protein